MTFRLRHLLAALALHAVLLGLLAGGVQCSVKPLKPPIITGVLLDPSREDNARRQREERRRVEAERKRREAEARSRAAAEDRKKKEAEAKKKKEAETAALRQKQAAEKKAAEEAARRKREQAEKAEREAAARRQAEERARVEQAMQDEAARRQAERAAQAQAEGERLDRVAEWAHALVRHVQNNYRKPPGAPDAFACQVRLQLLPDGTVTNFRILKNCGDALLDRAVEDAVFRSSPMPRPADPSVFESDLTINFTP